MRKLLDLGSVAFGCDPLGGHNWGNVDPAQIMASIPYAIERGVKLFDTADCYGAGLSELRLGQALAGHRDHCLIGSKFGVRIDNSGKVKIDNRPEWIMEAVDASLDRLRCDAIDIYQLHWWDKITPFDAIFEALERLVSAGKIRSYGSTNVSLEMMGLTSCLELPDNYVSTSLEYSLVNIANRDAIRAMCEGSDGPAFLSWGSLGGGILSGKYKSAADLDPNDRRLKRADSYFAGNQLEKSMRIVAKAAQIAKSHGDGIKTSQVALQWISASLGFGTCLVGIKSKSQLDEAIDSFAFRLTAEDVAQLEEVARSTC